MTPDAPLTKSVISAVMRELGRKGGRVGGKRCLETMTPAERRARAVHAARARWARHATARVVAEWSRSAWPPGTTVDIRFKDGLQMTNCVIWRYTRTCVYWSKPEYDGAQRGTRRHRLDEFKAGVASGTIRKSR